LKPEFQAALFFLPEDDIAGIAPLGAGNINDTYAVTLRSGERRILQRLNPSVFQDPHAVMRNIRIVLDHLRREIQNETSWGNKFTVLSLYTGKSGDWFAARDGSAWRLMSMVRDSITCSSVSDPRQAKKLGRGLGFFHRLLSNLDPEQLVDTLPDIHNTAKYLYQFDKIISLRGQPATVQAEFCSSFIQQRRQLVNILEDNKKKLRSGVIHGDPKVDNFLFDRKGKRVISLIDLDTIKSGLLLHDLGDALRSCCNSGGEASHEPEKIYFDPDLFGSWLAGYFTEAGFLLNKIDREHIVDSVQLITFELGLRFYTDYLDGNSYFNVRFPDQNIQRALVQFYLAQSIEKQSDYLQSLVREVIHTL